MSASFHQVRKQQLLRCTHPAYEQDNSATRLLGRTRRHRTQSPSFTDSECAQLERHSNKRNCSRQAHDSHVSRRPDTAFAECTDTSGEPDEQDGNIPSSVHEILNRLTGSVPARNRTEEWAANHDTLKEGHCPTKSEHLQVDPDYITGWKRRDILAQKAFYTTSTQKLYQGVDWPRRITPTPPPPTTSKEISPDVVSFRFQSKRYEPDREIWQQFGGQPFSWDYVQSRDGHHIPGPIRFCSPNRKVAHIPGYMGHLTGGPGEMDNPKSLFTPENKLRTLQPRYSDTARKANIPGYTGCVLYCDSQPACINDPDYSRSTASRTYRYQNEVQCNSKSPFKKTSSMSRMVTLTHPFNPFNKVH